MAIGRVSKMSAHLVKMSTPSSGTLYVTDLNDDFLYGVDTYLSHPTMAVDIPENSGGMQEPDGMISIDATRPEFSWLLERIAQPYPFAPVTVDIYEALFDEYDDTAEDTFLHLFHGRLATVKANKGGKTGVTELTLKSIKGRLDAPLGISCNLQCSWTLGDGNCKAVPLSITAEVESIGSDGHSITIKANSEIALIPDGAFRKGYMEYQGTRILIRGWERGLTFNMARPPHPEWIDQEISIISGCDKLQATCSGLYDNLERFAGLGLLMASHNPISEVP